PARLPLLITRPLTVRPQGEDEIDDWFLKAENAFKSGRDRKGLGHLDKVVSAVPDDEDALVLGLGPAMNIGRYDSADAWSRKLVELKPKNRRFRVLRAEILIEIGRLEDAETVLEPLMGKDAEPQATQPAIDFEARAMVARMRLMRGRREEADQLYDSLVQEAKRVIVKDRGQLVALAESYTFYRGLREAEKALSDAQKAAAKEAVAKEQPVDPRPSLALGRLYLDKFYLPGDAAEEFKAALVARPRLAAARWGLCRSYAAWQNTAQATDARRKTLATNPKYKAALVAKAAEQLGNTLLDAADATLGEVLAIDPHDRDALALKSLVCRITGRIAEAEATWKRLLEVDKTYSRGHLVVAEVLNGRRRWQEALASCRLATKVDPENPEAWDALARYAFFLGLEEEGHEALRRADKVDKFTHPWRRNMFENRRVLEKFYKEFETRHFVHRVHRREMGSFKPYLVPFCLKSWRILTKKYGFNPPGLVQKPGKVLVEWFSDHGDFSVRTLGFTHLGATGVCFGPFIGMNSPGARPPGEFSWARTFHHELAHTMTIGLAKGRMPRWLTEGLSTHEEKCYDAAWDRGLYRELHAAIANDVLCKVLTFDANFGGPRVVFAYFQGGLVCEWMAGRWGMPKIIEMLKAYGDDRLTPEILEDVLGTTAGAFDTDFKAWITERMKTVKLQPKLSEKATAELELKLRAAPKDKEALLGLAAAYADRKLVLDAKEMIYRAKRAGIKDPRLHLIEGRLAQQSKAFTKAREHYEKALAAGLDDHDLRIALAEMSEQDRDPKAASVQWKAALDTFPMISGAADPRLHLSRIAAGADDLDGAIYWLEEHVKVTYEDLKARKQLVGWYRLRKDSVNMRRHLVAMINVYPLDKSIHVGLGDLYLEEKKGDEAVTEFEVALSLQQLEPEQDRSAAEEATIRVSLGRAHMLGEDGLDEAEAQARHALELVPDHPAARTLLRAVQAARQQNGDKE
ncbi:MAG: hypothetical protein HRU14_04235, partial [Planctomycetes bacterium]|nr:hypothetical protein [Planctomycetota bacterium]